MLRNTCQLHVGRLLELHIAAGYESVADVDEIRAAIVATQRGLRGQHVTVADLRACKVLSEAASEYLLRTMRTVNPRTERSAMLQTSSAPTSVMQFLRLVKEAGHPQRRVFTDPHELVNWLAEVLTPAEIARAQDFLGIQPAESKVHSG